MTIFTLSYNKNRNTRKRTAPAPENRCPVSDHVMGPLGSRLPPTYRPTAKIERRPTRHTRCATSCLNRSRGIPPPARCPAAGAHTLYTRSRGATHTRRFLGGCVHGGCMHCDRRARKTSARPDPPRPPLAAHASPPAASSSHTAHKNNHSTASGATLTCASLRAAHLSERLISQSGSSLSQRTAAVHSPLSSPEATNTP